MPGGRQFMKPELTKLAKLLEVGDVGIYRTMDGGYGVSLDFYDKSYYLAHPADTIEAAIEEMCDEWRVKTALRNPEHLKKVYEKHVEHLLDDQEAIDE